MKNFDLKKYLAEGKLLKEEKRSIVDYDNRDGRTTELFLDNGDSVEVDVIELYNEIRKNNEDLAEGKLLKEDMKAPKFKIDDFVQPKSRDKYIGQIRDVYINKPENLEMKDGEYVYSVDKLNHRGRNAMSFSFKESDLESISDPTDYIKSLTPYKRRK
ncbi:hypothetical protein N9F64_00405 [bacterium]|nr:hypothetical protein [bacterium]